LQIGSVRCHLVSDGLNVADGGGFFGVVPRVLWQRVIQANELNQVPSDLRALLIESDAGLVLVDTGIGDKHTPKQRQILGLDERTQRLVYDLGQAGFRPEEVEIVLLTHLHNDHAGGSTRWDAPGSTPGPVVATFPRARYLVQRIDLAEASFPNERTAATYFAANWEPLAASGRLEVVDGPLRLGRQVRTGIAPGHTAALQVVWIEDGGEAALFLGDACSWAVHLERLAWVPAYDIYPMTSIETKRRLRHEALEKEALLLFQHDPQVLTGRLVEGARGPEVQPILTKPGWADPLAHDSTRSSTRPG
jgi:glyoxylase-like metal-dependent hydrolase (beta-lactamase superfamily II)